MGWKLSTTYIKKKLDGSARKAMTEYSMMESHRSHCQSNLLGRVLQSSLLLLLYGKGSRAVTRWTSRFLGIR